MWEFYQHFYWNEKYGKYSKKVVTFGRLKRMTLFCTIFGLNSIPKWNSSIIHSRTISSNGSWKLILLIYVSTCFTNRIEYWFYGCNAHNSCQAVILRRCWVVKHTRLLIKKTNNWHWGKYMFSSDQARWVVLSSHKLSVWV